MLAVVSFGYLSFFYIGNSLHLNLLFSKNCMDNFAREEAEILSFQSNNEDL